MLSDEVREEGGGARKRARLTPQPQSAPSTGWGDVEAFDILSDDDEAEEEEGLSLGEEEYDDDDN
jgi:hypothetical protein